MEDTKAHKTPSTKTMKAGQRNTSQGYVETAKHL